ncbi:hypothetical protein Pcinc_016131 [Petrolisthes cinctipes]|nr:hypothetical protein Pcinc_016131 [Petrolisthes cinctipes]
MPTLSQLVRTEVKEGGAPRGRNHFRNQENNQPCIYSAESCGTCEFLGQMAVQRNISTVSTAVLYGSLSFSMAFLNKMLMSQYSFNYPYFILSCQMLLSVTVLELLRVYELLDLPRITPSAIKMFALPALFYSLHAILALAALEGLNIPMYGAVKRCTPLVNLILAAVYLKKTPPSPLVIISVLTITFGCLTAAFSDPDFNGVAYIVGGVSVVVQALYLTLVQQCGIKMSPVHILHLNSYISAVPFMILTVIRGELVAVLHYPHLTEVWFVSFMITVVGMGLLLNFSLFHCTVMTSALTTSIVGVIKSVLQTVIGFFAFGGISYHPVNVAGIILNLTGGVLYTYAKYKDQRNEHKQEDVEDDLVQEKVTAITTITN